MTAKQIRYRAGYHQVPHDRILSRYFAHDNDNITIQRFCDNRHIARNFILNICVTEEIQNLLTALNPFHRNFKHCQSISHEWQPSKQRVYCTVSLNTHTDYNYYYQYRYVWVSELLKPFFFILFYLCLNKGKVGGVVVVGQKKKKIFLTFLNIDIWHQCIENVPQDEISWYIS